MSLNNSHTHTTIMVGKHLGIKDMFMQNLSTFDAFIVEKVFFLPIRYDLLNVYKIHLSSMWYLFDIYKVYLSAWW